MRYIVRLFPEITVKSAPVRKRMTRQLVENLRILLRRYDSSAKVHRDWDNIEVEVDGEEPEKCEHLALLLANIPGIAKFAHVQAYHFESMDDIYQKTAQIWGDQLQGKTFCVRVKRRGDHKFNSTELERFVGGGLNQHFASAGVKLKNPDVLVPLEVRDDQLFVVEKYYAGIGGFPIGTQGEVMSLVSGGYDSTVASYQSITRGLRTHYLFFNLGGTAHELAVKELAFFLWHRFSASHRVKFVSVPFADVVNEILQKVHPSCMGVILKRMMLRAGEIIAAKGGMTTLVTGEAVAQVSSQTLPNLAIIDRVTNALVLRPLALMNKGDIIALSREIGVEDFSANIPEYCGVISVRPSAHLRLQRVEEEEQKMALEDILQEALSATKVQAIDEVMADVAVGAESPEHVSVPTHGDVVIDIRHPHESLAKPLSSKDFTFELIPFYSLNHEFAALDKLKRYLLFCDRGVMSELHASHLLSEGYRNVAVFKPK